LLLAACGQQRPAIESTAHSLTDTNRALIVEYARLRQAGSTHTIMERYNSAGRIEHNPEIPDGISGDRTYLEGRRAAEPNKYDPVTKYVNVVHNFLADGDLVAVKSHVFVSPSDPGRVFVDIWRFANGQFAEHWDVIQPVGSEPGALSLMACGVGATYEAGKALENTAENPSCGKPDPAADGEANRKRVLEYMELGAQPGKLAQAVETYVAADFVQHSPNIPAGKQGLLAYLEARVKQRRVDNRRHHFQRVLADGDLVLVHRWVTSDSYPRGTAYADLFRLKGGKIAEHWDLVQPVPPYSVAGHSMTGGPDTPLEPDRRKGAPASK
jgi:predicted SnoaL-like aldol condensation-catalyzing enzyme